MRRRDLLTGTAALGAYAALQQSAQSFGIGKLGADFGGLGSLGGASSPITVPSGYNRWTPSFTFTRRGRAISTNFDITTLIPAITNTWYVDPISGNDGTAVVNDRTHPLLNLATALAKANVDQIRIFNLGADFNAKTLKSWNAVPPTRSLSVIVEGNFRYISSHTGSAAAPTWSVNGSFANVYQATISLTNGNVVDLSIKTAPTLADGVTPNPNVPKYYNTLNKVASIAAVAATAGTYFYDGTIVYVRATDDRNLIGDVLMQPMITGSNGKFPTAVSNLTIYVQGIDFVGGTPFSLSAASSVTGCVFAHNNCSFQGANNGVNGLNVTAFVSVYGYRSGAYYNSADGFNYHSFENDNGVTPGTSPNWFENECCALGNGTTGSANVSDNASTSHDFCNGIQLNCIYNNSADRVNAHTNSAYLWSLGTFTGQSLGSIAGDESVVAQITAKLWMDTCTIATGANNQVAVEAGAFIGIHSMASPLNTGPTAVTPY